MVLLLGARHANAAGKCEGQWHFELSRPNPAAEEWLPKGSFCGASKLPTILDVSLRYRTGGGGEMSGSPYNPTDVMTAGGQCVTMDGTWSILRKPFNADDLAAAIAKLSV